MRAIASIVRGVPFSASVARDLVVAVVFFGGLGLVVYGVRLVSVPAGWIVGGLALTLCAAFYARGERRPQPPV